MSEAKASLARWQGLWQQLGASTSNDELFFKLVKCYSEPHRKYHTMQHLNECFTHLEIVRSIAERSGEVELALWFHDAIYNTPNYNRFRKLLASIVAHKWLVAGVVIGLFAASVIGMSLDSAPTARAVT